MKNKTSRDLLKNLYFVNFCLKTLFLKIVFQLIIDFMYLCELKHLSNSLSKYYSKLLFRKYPSNDNPIKFDTRGQSFCFLCGKPLNKT